MAAIVKLLLKRSLNCAMLGFVLAYISLISIAIAAPSTAFEKIFSAFQEMAAEVAASVDKTPSAPPPTPPADEEPPAALENEVPSVELDDLLTFPEPEIPGEAETAAPQPPALELPSAVEAPDTPEITTQEPAISSEPETADTSEPVTKTLEPNAPTAIKQEPLPELESPLPTETTAPLPGSTITDLTGYEALKKHLSNFLRNTGGDGILKGNVAPAKQPETAKPTANQQNPETTPTDIADPLFALPPMQPLMQETFASDLARIRPELNIAQIEQTFASCLSFPAHIQSCKPFACQATPFASDIKMGGSSISYKVKGLDAGQCTVYLGSNYECRLSPNNIQYLNYVLITAFKKGIFPSFDEVPNWLTDELEPGWDNLVSECRPIESTPQIDEALAVDPAINEEEAELAKSDPFDTTQRDDDSEITPDEISTEPEPNFPSQEAQTARLKDQVYLDYMDDQKAGLLDNERLSEESEQAISDIRDTFTKEQKTQPMPTDVNLARGQNLKAEKTTPGQAIQSPSGMDITITDNSKNYDTVSIEEKLEQAYRALILGQNEAAINIYKEVLDSEHDNTTALFGLATTYHKNRQERQARAIYTELLEIEPNHREALNNFLILVAEEAPKDALIELKKLERINPEFSPLPAQIAMIYVRLGQIRDAERYLKKALSLDPQNISYIYNLAVVSDRLNKKRQAVAFYHQLVKAEERGAIIPGTIENIKDRLTYLKSARFR